MVTRSTATTTNRWANELTWAGAKTRNGVATNAVQIPLKSMKLTVALEEENWTAIQLVFFSFVYIFGGISLGI